MEVFTVRLFFSLKPTQTLREQRMVICDATLTCRYIVHNHINGEMKLIFNNLTTRNSNNLHWILQGIPEMRWPSHKLCRVVAVESSSLTQYYLLFYPNFLSSHLCSDLKYKELTWILILWKLILIKYNLNIFSRS